MGASEGFWQWNEFSYLNDSSLFPAFYVDFPDNLGHSITAGSVNPAVENFDSVGIWGKSLKEIS